MESVSPGRRIGYGPNETISTGSLPSCPEVHEFVIVSVESLSPFERRANRSSSWSRVSSAGKKSNQLNETVFPSMLSGRLPRIFIPPNVGAFPLSKLQWCSVKRRSESSHVITLFRKIAVPGGHSSYWPLKAVANSANIPKLRLVRAAVLTFLIV